MDEATEPDIVDEEGEPKRNFRRVLEDKATQAEARASELEAELTALKRTEAFREAGINPADPRQSYFVKGYDGEINAEAIRTSALEAGFIDANSTAEAAATDQPQVAPETVTYREELLAQQRVADAGFQGQPVESPDLQARIRATRSPEELRALLASEGISVNTQG